LPELVNPHLPHRETVDLIFFPTGGGKTEAYLGVAAISILLRRLRNKYDAGTDVLMRYTLRLLTTQQFERASSLTCALEELRQDQAEILGTTPFSIGIWVGGETTPNTNEQASDNLKNLRKKDPTKNKLLLTKCPYCGAAMGPLRLKSGQRNSLPSVLGYEKSLAGGIKFQCADSACPFSKKPGLPIYVVDENIYRDRPSMIIGTVDKFAMLAWNPAARAVFGLGEDGTRIASPPNLIIQDELHLISGPLGSMVGFYEVMIDDLCTSHAEEGTIKPKIIASTATIRGYTSQVTSLYGRKSTALFPPQGLEEGHTFFAEPETEEDGTLTPGRRYIGIMAASLGSTQLAQVRALSALLLAAKNLPEEDRDYYWTNLNFFNSLRELGNTVSLIQSLVPDDLKRIAHQNDYPRSGRRYVDSFFELTSQLPADELQRRFTQLQNSYAPGQKNQKATDICLASSIIEVGVDVDRLGLMTILGQPKTTSQYIQVSGRVGRRPRINPGLVVVIYNVSRPRDRSHYERFQDYHQALYAQVEPVSITPFAKPLLRRALHAGSIVHIRQTSPTDIGPQPFPADAYNKAIELMRHRAEIVDPEELPVLQQRAHFIRRFWQKSQRTKWDATPPYGDPANGLMRYPGSATTDDNRLLTWEVPTSMRTVDAQAQLRISHDYAIDDRPEEGKSV
jgi:hypothetical protein